jgi:hypothetical protein
MLTREIFSLENDNYYWCCSYHKYKFSRHKTCFCDMQWYQDLYGDGTYCLKVSSRIPSHRLLRLSLVLLAVIIHLTKRHLMKQKHKIHCVLQVFWKPRNLLFSRCFTWFIHCGRVFHELLNVTGRRHVFVSCDHIVFVSDRWWGRGEDNGLRVWSWTAVGGTALWCHAGWPPVGINGPS